MDTFYQIQILLWNAGCDDFVPYLFVLKLSTLDREQLTWELQEVAWEWVKQYYLPGAWNFKSLKITTSPLSR